MQQESDRQIHVLKKMSPAQKLKAAWQLYQTAWQLKRGGLKMLHPDWPVQRVEQEVKKIFFYART